MTEPVQRQTAPVRMEPIASLPVFFKLGGKRALLAGGTAPAVWKAELLSAAGARVVVVAMDVHPDLLALAAQPPGGDIDVIRRAWTPADLDGAAIAIGAIEDDEEAGRFVAAAHAAGVPVNVIDRPAFCDFQFGTIVSRSPLVLGISTDGAAPVFGQAIRARIEALLPHGLTGWARAARDWRPAVQDLQLDFRRRRRFWETFATLAFQSPENAPSSTDFDRCRSSVDVATAAPGELALVCAGPGDPDRITLEAIRLLQAADVVLHGADLSPTIVNFARREALKIALPADRDASEAVAQIAAEAAPGHHIVWLDTGNPECCRRWDDRAAAAQSIPLPIVKVAGLGRCPACTPGCPAWAP